MLSLRKSYNIKKGGIMSNKELKQKRMLIYFIEAAQDIMNKEGISNITLRKVADAAGYNSATLYNYFKDLDELILFASLKYLKLYNLDMAEKIRKCKTEEERFFTMWDSFCGFSFRYPEAFQKIFFNKHSNALETICDRYYKLFPEEIVTSEDALFPILSDLRLENRNKLALTRLLKAENLSQEHTDIMNELMVSAYEYLIQLCLVSEDPSKDSCYYKNKMLSYISFILGKNT